MLRQGFGYHYFLTLTIAQFADVSLGKMLNAYPISKGVGRLSRPEDVSGLVAFLASDRALFVTGQTIGASGGFAMI